MASVFRWSTRRLGSGKTRLLAEAARAWAAARLGPVIGITPSQSARNTLAVGVPVSYNSAQFLGHLPGRRGARGPVRHRRRARCWWSMRPR